MKPSIPKMAEWSSRRSSGSTVRGAVTMEMLVETISLQVTVDMRRDADDDRETIDIERLISPVPTAKAVYGDKFGSMMVTVDGPHRGDLERVLAGCCIVEKFETLDLYGLDDT